jgi:hypothetical protein
MRIQPANELSPITLVRDAGVWPLARRVARWSAWAWKMARRFGPRRQHVPFLGRILLQRAGIAYGRGAISYHRHVDWRPTFQWHHQSIVRQDNLPHRRHTGDEETQSRLPWAYQPLRLDADRGGHRRLEIARVAPADGGQDRMPLTARAAPAVFRMLALCLHAGGAAFQRREWTPVGAVVCQQNTLHSEKLAALSRQFIQRWHRVGARPDRTRSAGRQHVALRHEEGLTRVESNQPASRVFRQRTVLTETEPSPVHQVQTATTYTNFPFDATPQQLDLNKLTDQVMQQIDRRLVIWRERTGRV